MILTQAQSQSLCSEMMNSLTEQGDALLAALQAAGCERKTEGWIQLGMKRWLDKNAPSKVALTEYFGLDFVFVESNSVGTERLVFDTMFEAKFNYTSQNPELISRPGKAAVQQGAYMARHPDVDAYLIYLLADHMTRAGASLSSDRGWRYLGISLPGRFESGVEQMRTSAMAAGLEAMAHEDTVMPGVRPDSVGWRLHLELFRCVPRPRETISKVIDQS